MFALNFLALSFLCWLLVLLVCLFLLAFACFGFLLYFLFLLLDKSNFYVLVIVSDVLGLLGFVMCYLLDLFFLFLVFVVIGGFKGQVRWPKGSPHLALNPPYVICFVFALFLFVSFFGVLFLLLLFGRV